MLSMQARPLRPQRGATEVLSGSIKKPQVEPDAILEFPVIAITTVIVKEFLPVRAENRSLETRLISAEDLIVNNIEIQIEKGVAAKSSNY